MRPAALCLGLSAVLEEQGPWLQLTQISAEENSSNPTFQVGTSTPLPCMTMSVFFSASGTCSTSSSLRLLVHSCKYEARIFSGMRLRKQLMSLWAASHGLARFGIRTISSENISKAVASVTCEAVSNRSKDFEASAAHLEHAQNAQPQVREPRQLCRHRQRLQQRLRGHEDLFSLKHLQSPAEACNCLS